MSCFAQIAVILVVPVEVSRKLVHCENHIILLPQNNNKKNRLEIREELEDAMD